MTAKTILLRREDFFHARPAALVASAAKPFASVLMVALGPEVADAKNAFSLMRLSRPDGRPVELLADGPDEAQAVEAVEAAIRKAFGG